MRRFWDKVVKDESGCWLWTGAKMRWGYANFKIDGKYFRVHRLAWELVKGEIPEGLFVLHSCDVRHCVNPAHLFLGTQADNVDDMIKKGRNYTGVHAGVKNSNAKLTDDQVRAIRIDKRSQREIAKDYGVGRSTISMVKTSAWGHVK